MAETSGGTGMGSHSTYPIDLRSEEVAEALDVVIEQVRRDTVAGATGGLNGVAREVDRVLSNRLPYCGKTVCRRVVRLDGVEEGVPAREQTLEVRCAEEVFSDVQAATDDAEGCKRGHGLVDGALSSWALQAADVINTAVSGEAGQQQIAEVL